MNIFNTNRKSEGEPLTKRVSDFVQNKSILRDYNFLVYLDENPDVWGNGLRSYHAVACEIPDYSFEKIEYYAGPFVKTVPVLSHNGFEFTIKFEEDSVGTIKQLISELIRKNINSEGYHSSTLIPSILVSAFDNEARNVMTVDFKNCYYLKSSTANFDYASNGKITYDITFNADHYFLSDKKL